MIRSMLSPCFGAAGWSCTGAASPGGSLGAAGVEVGSTGCFGDTTRGGGTGLKSPDKAAPLLLKPITNDGIGTNAFRAGVSSLRPLCNDPAEQDTRDVHVFDLAYWAMSEAYADFFSSCGALTSVTSVDFIL